MRLSLITVVLNILFGVIWFTLDVFGSAFLHSLEWSFKAFNFARYSEEFFWYAFPLGIWSALYFMIKFGLESAAQKERAEKAHSLAQQAQLQMLRYQINPHFLFNSLNSIKALVDENRPNAKEMITELADFLRYTLTKDNVLSVPFREEIQAIKHYLQIEKKRFEEKMDIQFDIQEETCAYAVPVFLIHPLIENAIKHGMQTSPTPLTIKIHSRMIEDQLIVEICNSGKWIPARQNSHNSNGTGTGLKNVRQRLTSVFPKRHSFEIIKNPENVTTIITLQAEKYET